VTICYQIISKCVRGSFARCGDFSPIWGFFKMISKNGENVGDLSIVAKIWGFFVQIQYKIFYHF